MDRRVAILEATIDSLIELLADKGVVDRDTLAAHIHARLVAEESEPLAPPATVPSDTVACLSCKRRVPLSGTTVTAEGALCDACAPDADVGVVVSVPPEPSRPGVPAGAVGADDADVTCSSCGRSVPLSASNVTSDGVVCDACLA